MGCSYMTGSMSGSWVVLRKSAYMFIYQNQMRNLVQKKILQGTPQQLDYHTRWDVMNWKLGPRPKITIDEKRPFYTKMPWKRRPKRRSEPESLKHTLFWDLWTRVYLKISQVPPCPFCKFPVYRSVYTKGSTINDLGGGENREKKISKALLRGKKIQEAFAEKFLKRPSRGKKNSRPIFSPPPPRSLMVDP